ncbi:S-layer homology domain-containing protein [Paenibacillus sp. OVF10]|nr:S-layer homology domain-containing protein [Paenibacillus sp. OVF10]
MNGVLTTKVSHFSKYAVLELDRTFTDVPANHWASTVIKELAAKGYVEGTHVDQFEPGRAVTRAEFTTMLVHSLGLTVAGEVHFTDVATDAWYAEPISIAIQAGIVNGRSAARFQPDAQITREEITVMLMKAYERNVGKVPPVGSTDILFTDMDQVSSWATASVKDAARLGLVQGQRQGQFVPKGIASRAEAAQVIYNLILK